MSRVKVLVVTHGTSATALVGAVTQLVGGTDPRVGEDFAALEVPVGAPRQETAARVAEALARLEDGAGAVVALDLHGSTPSNCAADLQKRGLRVAIVTGVNLPMLIKLATLPREGVAPHELAEAAAETATRSIRVTGELT